MADMILYYNVNAGSLFAMLRRVVSGRFSFRSCVSVSRRSLCVGKEGDHKTFREEREQRLAHFAEQKSSDSDLRSVLYPPLPFEPSHTLTEFRSAFEDKMKPGEQLETAVSVCGRIYTKRSASKKLLFVDIGSDGTNIQIMASLSKYKPTEAGVNFEGLNNVLNRGDIIGAFM